LPAPTPASASLPAPQPRGGWKQNKKNIKNAPGAQEVTVHVGGTPTEQVLQSANEVEVAEVVKEGGGHA